MSDPDDREEPETMSTTLTYNEETDKFLRRAYPDAIGTSERIRNAIADARKVQEDYRSSSEEITESD